ncbi:bifunctional riboflavin kinase/FAD synthetase [candidate division KSB1 bacterium]|nr:bifunctional riboflavin kinase/FAD synthetase [candidate division KSB1 bacterium]
METVLNLNDCSPLSDGIVTVGTFDGVHLAHRAIIQDVISKAKSRNVPSTVVTFDPHPRIVLNRNKEQKVTILTTTEEKIKIVQSMGPDRLIVIPFTKEFSETPADTFVSETLCKKIGLSSLIVGYDHGFGKDRSGDSESLKKLGKLCDFDLEIKGPVSNNLGVISSSNIRGYILGGEIENANKCLGRNYNLSGVVIHGDGKGKELNFPTANIRIDNPNKCLPANGVYIVKINIGQASSNGVMNIGTRPTMDKKELSLEVHILDFYEDIYGRVIEIYFYEKIRNEKKFNSLDELKNQISLDTEYARRYFLKEITSNEHVGIQDNWN